MSLDNYKLEKIGYSCGMLEYLREHDAGDWEGKEDVTTLAMGMCVVRLWETCKSINDNPTWNEVEVLNDRFPEVPWNKLRECAIRVIHPTDFKTPCAVLAGFYKDVFPKVTQWYLSKRGLTKPEYTDAFSRL